MFSTLRNRFGIPGVISVIALVFAMIGGAYAASNSSGGGKATASAKAKRGPRGPKGATGPAGPQGPAGPAGAKGDAGANGANGAAGATGPTGPTGTAGAKGATGATGPTGQSGFTETLPSGKTETGVWADSDNFTSEEIMIPISFPIPLAAPAEEKAFFLNKEETKKVEETEETGAGECAGTVQHPTAPEGELCVYTLEEANQNMEGGFITFHEAFVGYEPAGTVLHLFRKFGAETAHIQMNGSWAVTAP
jgi:hypothetical protein